MKKNQTKLCYIGLLFICLLFITPSVFAQKDSKAKEWLDKSSQAFKKAGEMTIAFTMNIKDIAANATESFDGTIDIKGSKFHLDIPDMETWFDGKTQWVLQKGWDEVSISEPDQKEVQAINPATIFTIYQAGCNYKYIGERTDIKGKKVQEVELTPIAKNSDMTKIIMQINPTDYMPVKIQILYKNKIENRIFINKYQKNMNLPDSLFVFNVVQYPDAEMIDLR